MSALWIAAAVAGVALAVVLASLLPTRGGTWEAALIVLAVAAYAALRDLPDDEHRDPRTALLLFIGVAIYFALMRVGFAGWFRRQEELVRLGRPVEELKARHYAVFVLGFAVSTAIVIPFQ
ncbi:hypothetical protein ACFU6M_29300 [Streptomyces bottropensis]|uniref:hypothetical protein n=1 Tax=Streptomyces bottropensis TaxID=42235 RepID=UPI0036B6F70C